MKPYGIMVGLILVGLFFMPGVAWARPRKPAPKPAEVIEPSGLEPILGPSPAVRQEVESVPPQPVTLPTLQIEGTPPNTQEVEFRLVPVQAPGQGSGPEPN